MAEKDEEGLGLGREGSGQSGADDCTADAFAFFDIARSTHGRQSWLTWAFHGVPPKPRTITRCDASSQRGVWNQPSPVISISCVLLPLPPSPHPLFFPKAQADRSLPLRWTCPVAVRTQRWSAKSDVWSFGVLVWETFSLGTTPYSDRTAHEALQFVSQGGRLTQPPLCPHRVWQVGRTAGAWAVAVLSGFAFARFLL